MNHDMVIKMIETSKYNVKLIEGTDSKYYVRYEDLYTEKVTWTQPISDYNAASYLFDLRLNDLSKH